MKKKIFSRLVEKKTVLLSALLVVSANALAADLPLAVPTGSVLYNQPKPEQSLPPALTVDLQPQTTDPAVQRLLETHLVPSGFQISGVKAVPFELVAAEFSPFVGRDVTIAELIQAADQVTKRYKDSGYLLSFAILPAQSFADNVVLVNVVEGYVSDIRFSGSAGASQERLSRIASQLQHDRPLTRDVFDHVTGVLSLQPGMQINATVPVPVMTDGATVVTLDVKRAPPVTTLTLDKDGKSLRGIASVSAGNLIGLDEQIGVAAIVPNGASNERYYALSYAQPMTDRGLVLRLDLSTYQAQPENASLPAQQIEARYQTQTERVGLVLSYPLILEKNLNLTLGTGLYATDTASRYTRIANVTAPWIDIGSRVRALSIELSGSAVAGGRSVQMLGGVYRGFRAAGASAVNEAADLDFLRYKAQFTLHNPLPAGYAVILKGEGQYSSNQLPATEQIAFGAKRFGLGYPAGDIAGDAGWGLSLEVNRSFPAGFAAVSHIQPYLSTDAAQTYSSAGTQLHGKMASIGSGIRFASLTGTMLDVSIGQPVGERPFNATGRSPRLNMFFSYQIE